MTKQIICSDALPWLEGKRDVGAIVTSLPDADEIGATLEAWREWFAKAAALCIAAASPSAPVIFYQTDRKAAGAIESKAHMILEAGKAAGARVLWHKIVLRRAVGGIDLHRPGFTHLIALSIDGKPGAASADVLEAGRMIYANAMGLKAAAFAVRFAGSQGGGRLVDPFCGQGTIPAVADAIGLEAIGIDIDPEQCKRAEALQLSRASA